MLNRREFIRILAIASASYPLSVLSSNLKSTASNKPIREPWLTISEVQQYLFPKKSSIGAKDIQALGYLRLAMASPGFDEEENTLIHNGVTWLNDLSKKEYSKRFIQLDSTLKEKILRRIESSNVGERWLSTLLSYLLEALLTDPIYGGNPKGIGWNWLQHKPGFPRPPENKKYYYLDKKRYRKTKA